MGKMLLRSMAPGDARAYIASVVGAVIPVLGSVAESRRHAWCMVSAIQKKVIGFFFLKVINIVVGLVANVDMTVKSCHHFQTPGRFYDHFGYNFEQWHTQTASLHKCTYADL